MVRRIAKMLQWFLNNRREHQDGLLQWDTNFDNQHNPCDESGWDNSTRFDGAPLLDAIDLNAFFSRECVVLSRMATKLGLGARCRKLVGNTSAMEYLIK